MSRSISQEREGFQVRKDEFPLPEETWDLDPQTKRAVTICNLFVNYHYGVSDVVRLLDENRRHVVLVLLKQGIIRDCRVQQARPPDGIEHRKPVFRPKVTLRSP